MFTSPDEHIPYIIDKERECKEGVRLAVERKGCKMETGQQQSAARPDSRVRM